MALVLIVYFVLLFPHSSSAVRVSPKRANYYLAWEIPSSKIAELAKWDLLVLDMETQVRSPGALRKIRELNPDIIMLVYITPQEIKNDPNLGGSVMRKKLAAGIDESWYLTDINNKKLSFWPGTTLLNVSDISPQVNGLRLNEYIANFVAQELLSAGFWDGVFYDNAWKDVLWLTGDTVDLNKDGQKDDSVDSHWREGMRFIYTKTRALTNSRYLLVGNATSDAYKNDLNGIMLESFPSQGWENSMHIYNSNQDGLAQPRINIINANTGNQGNNNNFKKTRFGLVSTLLLNGYYSFDFGDQDHAQTWWYDEYNIELGKPIADAVSLSNKPQFAEDVWRREYENGIALVNSTQQPQEIDLGGEYEKIKGVQDPVTNDGFVVSQVNIKAKDGLMMLRTFQTLKNVVFANGDFIRFFDKNGKRSRNGLFLYENDVPGGAKIYHGDWAGDGKEEKIISTGRKLEIFNSVGGIWFSDYPFGRDYTGELRIWVGRLSGSPEDSIIVSQNKGGQAVVYNYHGGVVKDAFFPLGKKYLKGLSVAGSTNKNNNPQIIVGAITNNLPEVIVYDGSFTKINKRFFADSRKLNGEFNLAVGDVNGDGNQEIITALNYGTGKQIKIFNLSGKLLYQFKVSVGFNAGQMNVGMADVNFDGIDEIVLMDGQ